MNNIKLKIVKYNSVTNYYVEDYCTSIKLSNSLSQISSELVFSLPYATMSNNLLPVNIEMGDNITLFYKDNQIFNGKVTDTDLKGKAQELTVTCFDYTWWICKSNITKNFNDISIGSALDYIYSLLGAVYYLGDELGNNKNIMIKNHLVKKKPASKVLYAIYNEITKINGIYYYMHTLGDGVTITITEVDKYFSGLTIKPPTNGVNGVNEIDGNLIDFEITKSMQNMISRVDFFKTTGEVFNTIGLGGTIELDDKNMGRYGIIIENVEVSDDDNTGQKALAEGNNILNEKGKPSEELIVNCIGDIDYKVGHGVVVKILNTEYYDKYMYITSSEWNWLKDGSFLSKLSLSSSKIGDITDWSSIEEKQDSLSDATDTNGTSSDLVNRIMR